MPLTTGKRTRRPRGQIGTERLDQRPKKKSVRRNSRQFNNVAEDVGQYEEDRSHSKWKSHDLNTESSVKFDFSQDEECERMNALSTRESQPRMYRKYMGDLRLNNEVQLRAEEKWLVESLAKLKTQINAVQIERLHLQSLLNNYTNIQTADNIGKEEASMASSMLDVPNNEVMDLDNDQNWSTMPELNLGVSSNFYNNPEIEEEEESSDDDYDEENLFKSFMNEIQ